MSQLIESIAMLRSELANELDRFMLLWSYQHPLPPFRLMWRLALKRVLDFVGAFALLVVASPVMFLIALLIKLDSRGPVFYSQERVGLFGRSFNILKFRTMVQNAEASTGPVWTAKTNDTRVTRLGRFLRASHLDELPQLLNVLDGEMSLVGPRPERPCFVQQLAEQIPGYEHRLYIKPGITGLAQVHYRYDQSIEDVKKKLRFDMLYMRRMCLMLDARILVWTLVVCVTGKGIQ